MNMYTKSYLVSTETDQASPTIVEATNEVAAIGIYMREVGIKVSSDRPMKVSVQQIMPVSVYQIGLEPKVKKIS